MELTQDDIRMMRPTGCPWLFVAKLPYDRYWRVYTRDANDDGTMADWGDSNTYTGGWFPTKSAAVAYATELCDSGNWHGFGHDAPTAQEEIPMLYHYRSPLRPITQLPLQKLDWEYCEEFVGPDVRDMLTRRQLTDFEVSQLSLVLVGTRAA